MVIGENSYLPTKDELFSSSFGTSKHEEEEEDEDDFC